MRCQAIYLALGAAAAMTPGAAAQHDYPYQPVPFTQVHLDDLLWGPRIETNRAVTIPYAFEQCEKTGRIENFKVAGGLSDKAWSGGAGFNDSDVSKILQGAAYALVVRDDPKLRAYVDRLVGYYAAAQEKDGFLYTLWTARKTVADYQRVGCRPEADDRWSNTSRAHQLYNVGHMYEAGVAHFLATGKRTFLEVCLKNADLVCNTFNLQGRRDPPGHQEIEIGLAKLFRATGKRKYLDQARFFLEQRGHTYGGRRLYGAYAQDHKPVLEQSEAVGHAVRAMYMYSGMADVAALAGDAAYIKAIDRLWSDVVSRKLYITGGVGVAGHGEGFGAAYELPNRTAYSETCASIANVYWNHRMFLLHGESKYIDLMERALYNAVLSGVALDGKHFFYANPLASNGSHARSPWFGCACCPSNITRFLASVGGYAYAVRGDGVYVNLYAQGEARVALPGGEVKLAQKTRYPWDGEIAISVDPPAAGASFALALRLPGWAAGEAVPSDLYRFEPLPSPQPGFALALNGRTLPAPRPEKGYLVLRRRWQPGDRVTLSLPMPIRRIIANEAVAADRGRAALQRGPIVYCIEHPDVPAGKVHNLVLEDRAKLRSSWRADLLGGAQVISGHALSTRFVPDGEGRKIAAEPVNFTAIPYCLWAHRGKGEMDVWLARDAAHAAPLPMPTIASRARASGSKHSGPLSALNDQREPASSGDHSHPFLHWWPHKGTTEWVQYDFESPRRVSSVELYWFDDTGRGACRVPASWKLLYRDGARWKPVPNPSGFGCAKDRYNTTTFDALTTSALRIEVQLQKEWAGGIHEWRVR